MKYRMWFSIAVLAAGIAAFSLPAAGQTSKPATQTKPAPKPAPAAKAWPAPKTPWGDPDLQGVWNDATSTPLQRPNGKDKDILSDDEAAEFAQQLEYQLSRDRRDGGPDVDVNRAYNEHWMDSRRLKITEDRRTSLIVDPPDGRIPPTVPLSPEREKARAARNGANARFNAGLPENYHIIERFTRVGPTSINYEFTVSDPTTWTKPWTARIPRNRIDPQEQMYEYGCHEDNYDEIHFLSGARSREKRGETK